MSHPIVVAVTPGDATHDAVTLGVHLARLLDEPLLFAEIAVMPATVGPPVVPGWVPAYPDADALVAAARQSAERCCADVPAGVPCSAIAVTAPSVVDGLDRVAAEHDAAMVVIGASHIGATVRALRGDVALGVLRRGSSPVVTVPDVPLRPASEEPVFGVAWDDSPEAAEAVAVATDMAARAGASLRVIHVVGGTNQRAMDAAAHAGQRARALDAARSTLERVAAACRRRVPAEAVVVSGPVGRELEQLSDELDLLVLGSRRRGALGRLALGSTSQAALHQVRCPLLLVPRGAGRTAGREPEVAR